MRPDGVGNSSGWRGPRRRVARPAAAPAWRAVAAMLLVLVMGLPAADPVLAQADQGLQGGWAVDDAGNGVFFHSLSDQLPLMRQAGAGWVRVNFRLGRCYQDWTTPGCNGRTALQVYDDVIGRALGQNLRVLGLISHESWPGGQGDWVANSAEVGGGTGDNAYVRAFASGAAGVLARHFAGRIGWWELWNEPNSWTTLDDGVPSGGTFLFPSNYAWLLRRSYAAIKAARSDTVVVSGGLLAHDQGGVTRFEQVNGQLIRETRRGDRVGERRSARTARIEGAVAACQESRPSGAGYLCDLYVMGVGEAGWQAGAFPLDQVGLHLYVDQGSVTTRAKISAYLQDVRAAYLAYEGGGTSKRIEMTEGGWTTVFVDASTQAQNVRVLYEALRGTSYVGRGYWFAVQDIPEAGLYYGLTESDGRAKPSLTAYQQATGGAPPPAPAPVCSPRPPVAVGVLPIGGGRLRAMFNASGENNWLVALRVTRTDGAVVDVPGQGTRSGSFTVSLPAGTGTTELIVRRTGGGPATVQLTVEDRCGGWPTVVGGGVSAW